jgi:hypothetical protein
MKGNNRATWSGAASGETMRSRAKHSKPQARWANRKKSVMQQIPLDQVVLDFDFYPRHEVTAHTIRDMAEARKAGVEFPPILLDAKSKRVVDGFKRVRLAKRCKDKTISAVLKKYRSERDMFLDAMRHNAQHGQPLDAFDRAHCVILAGNLGISDADVAGALCVTVEKVNALRVKKSAKAGRLSIPIKRTIRHMAGKRLNKQQVDVNRKLGGMDAIWHVRQIVMLIESELIDRSDEKLEEELRRLHGLLDRFLCVRA